MENRNWIVIGVCLLSLVGGAIAWQDQIIHIQQDGRQTLYLPVTRPTTVPTTSPATRPTDESNPFLTILPAGVYRDWNFKVESGTPENPRIYDGNNQVVIDFGQPKFLPDSEGKSTIVYTGTDGFWSVEADHVIIQNVTFRGGGTGLQGEKAATRVADGKREIFFVGCTFENSIGCGVSINDTTASGIINCIIQDNGQIGYAFARTTNAVIRGNTIRRNNSGFDFDPKFVVNSNIQTVQVGNKWHIRTGFEAGGSKGARTVGALIEDNEAYENFGPGVVWFDIENTDAIIRNNHAHHNRKIGVNGGQGIFVELNSKGNFLIEGNHVHDNEGAGIDIAETRNVVVQNNRFENDHLQLRNLPDRASSSIQNVRITGNTFANGGIETRQGTWDSQSASRNKIEIRDNYFEGEFRLKWGDRTYQSLADAQSAVKQPIGKVSE